MSRIGTCSHARQLAEVWSNHGGTVVHTEWPEQYTCHWQEGHIPPPIARWPHDIRPGDCERCKHYSPALPTQRKP